MASGCFEAPFLGNAIAPGKQRIVLVSGGHLIRGVPSTHIRKRGSWVTVLKENEHIIIFLRRPKYAAITTRTVHDRVYPDPVACRQASPRAADNDPALAGRILVVFNLGPIWTMVSTKVLQPMPIQVLHEVFELIHEKTESHRLTPCILALLVHFPLLTGISGALIYGNRLRRLTLGLRSSLKERLREEVHDPSK